MGSPAFALAFLAAAVALSSCNRTASPVAESAQSTGGTVQPTASPAVVSTPMPAAPTGITNSSTANRGNDLSNATRASGGSTV